MMSARADHRQALPLLDWPHDRDISRLISEREDLRRRIAALPRFSHQRVALQMQLEQVTRRQLQLELGRGKGR